MPFTPRQSVRTGLDHLERRLDPIIQGRLASVLGGLPWTAVLSELDHAKGKAPRHYNANDVQCQLRMLTERLGQVGYPFDDDPQRPRYISSLASELRIMRNVEKHNDEISTSDAWRFHDTVTRLLKHFDDADGLSVVEKLRAEALTALAAEAGLSAAETVEHAARPAVPSVVAAPAPSAAKDDEGEADVVPDEAVLVRDDADTTPTIGGARPSFEPWVSVQLGDVEILDAVARKDNKDRVRAAAAEIVEFEGPIHIDRLVTLVAASFNAPRLTAKRRQKVERQVRQLGLHVDEAKFLWPTDVEPATWSEFRPNDSSADREFIHISPVEVANAMRFIAAREPEATSDDLDVATLRTFGRQRRTKLVAHHLQQSRFLLDS